MDRKIISILKEIVDLILKATDKFLEITGAKRIWECSEMLKIWHMYWLYNNDSTLLEK